MDSSHFSEIVNNHNDVFMAIKRRWVTLHEVNGPFAKWTSNDNKVQWGLWGPCLRGKKLTVSTMLNCLNTISEESRPEIAYMHDFLGSGHP
jgi:hypothetical protein